MALGIATLSGLGGARVVFWFLAKVLMAREEALDPADYDMIGVLGKLSMPIRAGGTGELIYSQEGTRRVAGARTEDRAPRSRRARKSSSRATKKELLTFAPWEELAGDMEQKELRGECRLWTTRCL